MRRLNSFPVLFALILAGCAPGGSNNSGATYSTKGTTGMSNGEGVPYVSGGDDRLDEAREQQERPAPVKPSVPETPSTPQTPVTPAPRKPAPVKPAALKLEDRLTEYEITRKDDKDKPAKRFGEKLFTIKIFFSDEPEAVFEGAFTGKDSHFTISSKSGSYTLNGTFDDFKPQKTKGDLNLTNTKTGETVRILYVAYKAKLKVHRDREKTVAPGSLVETRLRDLQDNTFGWVNNWAVVHGKAFYLVDIIKVVSTAVDDTPEAPPIFAFKGESLRTGEHTHAAASQTPGFADGVELVGNSEDEGLRLFKAEIEDKGAAEKYEFMFDLEEQKETPAATPGSPATTQPDEDDEDVFDPPTEPSTPGKPAPVKPAPKPPTLGNSYLRVNTSLPRTARMARDMGRNRSLPGVLKQISIYKGSQKLNNFYHYAAPLKPMIEGIGETFDVAPTYAYLTIIESEYLTGGRYNNRQIGDHGAAYGPFQMHKEAASESRLLVTGRSDDERYYFAPAACGAARYMVQNVDKFKNSDTTLAILAYNQGGAGAERLARRYGYAYTKLSRANTIPQAIRDYVDKKLAIYFISSDMTAYGFNPKVYTNKTLPPMNTILPAKGIHDSQCRAAVTSAGIVR